MKVRSKFWIEVEGQPVFGRGKRSLLEAIDKYGSINRAAKETDISYRKAWSYLNAMEERLGMRLVERQTGGKDGGGARLTENAKTILKKYKDLEKDLQRIVEDNFKRIFEKN